jgi:DNA-binding transcriptional regulator LsrR (DeoR family)
LVNDPETNEKLIEAARARGAIGEMCSWFFNKDGEPVETRYTTVGLGYAGLKRIAADPSRRVVLVTGGDVKRFRPLRVALKAGLASCLVTDTVTARYLVDELG